jgi:hypothetical protein
MKEMVFRALIAAVPLSPREEEEIYENTPGCRKRISRQNLSRSWIRVPISL